MHFTINFKSLILLLFSIILNSGAFSQQIAPLPTDVPNILPPSPTVADLGKYALAGANLSTGAAATHISLYNYATKNLSLPISLDYSSDGIKVDQVATRVGLGWTLIAGGSISRTVVGLPDEQSGYLSPPTNWQSATGTVLSDFLNAATDGAHDTQPDIYSFNFAGYSGRFILENNVITKLEQNNLQISGSVASGFTIITQDGVTYYFTITESTQSINAAHPGSVTDAWLLTKVVHPQGDIINLTYASCQYTYLASVNQSYTYYDHATVFQPIPGYVPQPDGTTNTSTPIVMSHNSLYLTEISSSSARGGYLKFIYSPRQDIPGDYALTNILLYHDDNPPQNEAAVKNIELDYYYATADLATYPNQYPSYANSTNQRLFLVSLVNDDQGYQFFYNDMDHLPPRCSFSQDDYGFFNGKLNSSLIPKPFESNVANAFSQWGFGDRTSDGTFAQKGLLNKVVFPTGGYQEIDYEPNSIYQPTAYTDCNSGSTTVLATGDSYLKNVNYFVSVPFHVSCSQEVSFNLSLSLPAGINQQDPPGEDVGKAAIIPAGFSFNNLTPASFNLNDINSNPVSVTMGQNNSFTVMLSPGDYELALLVQGNSHAFCNFSYSPGITYPSGNQNVAGVRMKRVTSYDAASTFTNIKRYYYNDLSTGQSSGHVFNANQTHESQFTTYTNLASIFSYCNYEIRYYYKYSSANYFGINNLTGNHIYYDKVYESTGENFDNGGVEHDFQNSNDMEPIISTMSGGNAAPLGALSNAGINSHRETANIIFHKSGNNYIPNKAIMTTYTDDSRLSSQTPYYFFQNESGGKASVCITSPSLDQYVYLDYATYYLYSRWSYPSSVQTITYDTNGQNAVTLTQNYTYNNISHQLVSTEQHTDSKNDSYTVTNLYPQDNIPDLTPPEQSGQTALINSNIISPVLEQQFAKNGTLLQSAKFDYAVQPVSSLVLPSAIETQFSNLASETRVLFNQYDGNGNILQQQKASGPPQSFIWDYTNAYLTAEVTNANVSDIAYTSFEADGDGNWIVSSAIRDPTSALTGTNSYNLSSGNITKSGLSASTTYVVSYWLKNNSGVPLSIPGTIPGYPITGRSYNGWTYYEHLVNGQTVITVTGNCNIDELRLFPNTSQMVTYTYVPLVGTSSKIDAKNDISYYEYDAFNHLKNIKDQNGNILKNFTYNYAGSSVNYGVTRIYQSNMQSGNFTSKNCSSGSYGTAVSYTVNYGAYTSQISQQDADNQALSALNTLGQSNANSTGTCVVCDLSNPANKLVNGVCETGSKIYTSSAKQNNGQYVCSYYYSWSDGSTSQIFQDPASAQPCVNLN